MRDMILVERVTDGEKCGSNCGQKDWRGYNHKNEGVNLCVAFKHERLWGNNSKPKRCPQCLATPSAVVVTPDMLEAIEDACNEMESHGLPYTRALQHVLCIIKPRTTADEVNSAMNFVRATK